MTHSTDPADYGFTKRTTLELTQGGELALAIRRKSRFLRKDVTLFLTKAEQIKKITGSFPILLLQAPLCSKAKQELIDHQITLVEE